MKQFDELVFDGSCLKCMFLYYVTRECLLDGQNVDGCEQCHCPRLRDAAWLCQRAGQEEKT